MACSEALRFKLDSLLDELEWHQLQALRAQAALRKTLDADAEMSESMAYLMSIPGVGWIIASYCSR